MVYKDDTPNSAVNFSSTDKTKFGEVRNGASYADLLESNGLCCLYVFSVLLMLCVCAIIFSDIFICSHLKFSNQTRHN